MAIQYVATKRALLVTWGTPELEDITTLTELIRQQCSGTHGSIFYVTRVPHDAPAPEGEVRRKLNSVLPTIADACAAYHVILEGEGFYAAMKRGVLLSLFQLTQKRGLFHVHASIEALRAKLPLEWRAEVTALLDLAQARKIV